MTIELGRDEVGPSSDDDEEDRRNFIGKSNSNSHSFNIDDNFNPSLRRRFQLNKKMCLWLVILLIPLLFVLLLYSSSISQNPRFSGVRLLGNPSDQMRESELRALYLLKQQQLGLINVLNHTLQFMSNFTNYNSSSGSDDNSASGYLSLSGISSDKSVFEELKARIYQGVVLNKEIQQVLLSTHKSGNVSESGGESGGLLGESVGMCGKIEQKKVGRRTIEWNPRSDKYLLVICLSGQMSNHLICLEKHMFFAALLGRVLIIPSHKVDFNFSHVLDIDHINKCVGKKVVVTFEEFSEAKKDLKIDKFICYFSQPVNCFVDDDHVMKLKSLGLLVPKLESPWVEDVKKPKKRTIEDVKSKFTSDDEVIAIGDVFFADVEKDWVMQSGGPIAHNCKTLIEPSRLIILTAQRFVQTFLGKDFVALHFRRHGWLKYCNAKTPSCFFSAPQAANCITRVVERANTRVIYLSTDAGDSETNILQSMIVVGGKPVALVQRPARNSAEKWDALIYRHGLDGDSQVDAMLDKTICAMSTVFIGSSGSTFTEDILRLRRGWETASVCDEYICQGELPNFIAEDE